MLCCRRYELEIAFQYSGRKPLKYAVDEHFTNMFSINILQLARYINQPHFLIMPPR